jgi:hypothetical protein
MMPASYNALAWRDTLNVNVNLGWGVAQLRSVQNVTSVKTGTLENRVSHVAASLSIVTLGESESSISLFSSEIQNYSQYANLSIANLKRQIDAFVYSQAAIILRGQLVFV